MKRLTLRWPALGLATALLFACTALRAEIITLDISGTPSQDVAGSAANANFSLVLGAGAHVTGIGWDVDLTAYSPSWLTEMKVSLLDSSGTQGIVLSPGFGENQSGTAHYTTGGLVDLTATGNDFRLGTDGALALQFYEDYNDASGADGVWSSGVLTIEFSPAAAVPEPASGWLMAAGAGAVWCRGRRRSIANALRGTSLDS